MKFTEYQLLAQRTSNPELDERQHIENGALGLCGEAGEVADLIKKMFMQGHALDKDEVIEELGDVAWYCAELATHAKLVIRMDNMERVVYDSIPLTEKVTRLCYNAANTAAMFFYVKTEEKLHKQMLERTLGVCRVIAGEMGVSMSEVCKRNLEKLLRRYPEKFSTERSVNREG